MVTRDYTVKLDQVFNGPLDLLLHLVREQEVEIHEIEITRVIDGYLKYLKDLREIDISADRITKRGQRILDVDLGEEPELPKPREESLPFAESVKGRK